MLQTYSVKKLRYDSKIINFMSWNKIALITSILFLLISGTIICTKGFNWGIDFTGGKVIEISLEKPINLDFLRKGLIELGFQKPIVQHFGSNLDVIIRITSYNKLSSQEIRKKVIVFINNNLHQKVIIKRIEIVGPSVGNDLAQTGIIAISLAFIAILVYIGFRFEWRLSLGTILALIHDIIITCGILSFFYIELDLTIIASLMSVISYSLNDKIVVFDRIRENFRKINNSSSYEITNLSLNQTMSRTIITSLITLTMILILFIFGGSMLKSFSLTMLIGVIIGIFSSIYISSALALKLGMKREHMLIHQIEKEGDDHSSILP
ncbi:protein translocase subunit SecF [Pantoea sp. Aalb]|uniref:protein translocase subunit SecF n=1 Tax=Pantoea sp. Aalb TaxID=2576762 RepID=UPI0013291A30|nr:protein translocase subunit SecF [Pantoea sp. Aalb]MXP67589.1 protein translocase subunit SecF [Pantoea sp. Aalb]